MLILGGAANLNFNLTHPEFLKNQYQKNFLGTFTVYFYYSSQNIRRIKLLIRGGALNYQHMISTRPHMKTLHIWSLCAGFYRGLLWSFEKTKTCKTYPNLYNLSKYPNFYSSWWCIYSSWWCFSQNHV